MNNNVIQWWIYDSAEDCYANIAKTRHFNDNNHNSTYKHTDTSYNIFLLDAMGMTENPSDEYIKYTKADDGENKIKNKWGYKDFSLFSNDYFWW